MSKTKRMAKLVEVENMIVKYIMFGQLGEVSEGSYESSLNGTSEREALSHLVNILEDDIKKTVTNKQVEDVFATYSISIDYNGKHYELRITESGMSDVINRYNELGYEYNEGDDIC